MSIPKSVFVNICRALLAITFIFSGFVKAIDPMGTQYKLDDYVKAVGMAGIIPEWILLMLSVILSALEFTLGVLMLMAIRRRLVSRLTLVFMTVMTAVTLWLAVANPIQDCGCFGDAIHLTNAQTFAKNVVLLLSACIVAKWPLHQHRFISKTNQWIAVNFTIIFIFAASLFSLYYLPIFDFRPYYIGQNIQKAMEIPPGAKQTKYKTTFICVKNGVEKEFDENNYPYNDTTWMFKDTRQEILEHGYEPPIHNFSITDDKTDADITRQILNRKGYTFLFIAPFLEIADDSNFADIERIYQYAKINGYGFIGLTSSTYRGRNRWRELTGAEYPFYTTDGTTLKTIVRSNPGLVLLYQGTIINKWSTNNMPGEKQLTAPLALTELGSEPSNNTWTKILLIVLGYVLPLVLLIIADRLWAWTRWLRKREQQVMKEENE